MNETTSEKSGQTITLSPWLDRSLLAHFPLLRSLLQYQRRQSNLRLLPRRHQSLPSPHGLSQIQRNIPTLVLGSPHLKESHHSSAPPLQPSLTPRLHHHKPNPSYHRPRSHPSRNHRRFCHAKWNSIAYVSKNGRKGRRLRKLPLLQVSETVG